MISSGQRRLTIMLWYSLNLGCALSMNTRKAHMYCPLRAPTTCTLCVYFAHVHTPIHSFTPWLHTCASSRANVAGASSAKPRQTACEAASQGTSNDNGDITQAEYYKLRHFGGFPKQSQFFKQVTRKSWKHTSRWRIRNDHVVFHIVVKICFLFICILEDWRIAPL
jgi:hypothetical protein